MPNIAEMVIIKITPATLPIDGVSLCSFQNGEYIAGVTPLPRAGAIFRRFDLGRQWQRSGGGIDLERGPCKQTQQHHGRNDASEKTL